MDVGLEYETGFETRRGARRGKVTVLPYGGAWAALVEPPDAPLPAEAAPAAERRSLAEQLGEATRVLPVCKAARAPVYSARYSDLKNIW